MILFIRPYVRVMFIEFDMLTSQVAEAMAAPLGLWTACSSFSWLVGVWTSRSWGRCEWVVYMLALDIPSDTKIG